MRMQKYLHSAGRAQMDNIATMDGTMLSPIHLARLNRSNVIRSLSRIDIYLSRENGSLIAYKTMRARIQQ